MLRRRTKSGTNADGKSNAANMAKRVPGDGPMVLVAPGVEVDASTGIGMGDIASG